MVNILKIDTSDNKKIEIELIQDHKKDKLLSTQDVSRSENALFLIDKILNKNKISPKNISRIFVNTKFGSFTGVRVGVSLANAFGFLLKIPINNKNIGEPEFPSYNK